MPNIKSAKKRVLVTAKKSSNNNDIKSSMRTAIKKMEKEPTNENLVAAVKKVDKACKSGVIKKNTADKYKSRLSKKLNETK